MVKEPALPPRENEAENAEPGRFRSGGFYHDPTVSFGSPEAPQTRSLPHSPWGQRELPEERPQNPWRRGHEEDLNKQKNGHDKKLEKEE
ncbi:unnamed protein product [Cylicostephanus goldi]|uniref:Uncharacterized protein n=1 Tax=Cylicostephanus goldi TaxID=71465 RepID=A0A3P6SZP9_CYLGO|nr:unnamed protein product [Cylicostephanus goldi]